MAWTLLVVSWVWSIRVFAFVDYGNVYPVKYSTDGAHSLTDARLYDNSTSIELSSSKPTVILDYGTDVAGFPFFVTSTDASGAQIEVKYSESFVGLSNANADGPWTFSDGLSNTFRVETFQISKPGYLESYFIQGGQRWQSIRLLGNESITLDQVGFRATSQHLEADVLPGHMTTSNTIYNKIFDLGGRVAQVACVDAGNALSTWEITNEGALIRGQASAQSARGAIINPANYTLEFDTKIVRGGTGWRVASGTSPEGPYFVLTSDYPEDTTFKNTNKTLLPPNTLLFNSGFSLVNQTTVETPANQLYPLDFSVKEGTWYRVSTTVGKSGYRVRLDGKDIALVPIPSLVPSFTGGPTSRYEGTWGFGGFQDQVAIVTNVSVTSANGTQIYQSRLTSNETLAEYGIDTLAHSVCLDGAKRDRLIWIGDFYHTVRVVAQTTTRWDYILGTIDLAFGYQVASGPYAGFVPISQTMGSRPEYAAAYSGYSGLNDYQDLFLAGIAEYFRYTGDSAGLQTHWNSIKKLAKARMAFIDPVSGLMAGSAEVPSPSYFLGPVNGSAVTGLFAFTLHRLVSLAQAMNDTQTAVQFNLTASKLNDAINKALWNPSLGTYSLSLDSTGNFSYTGISWCILSGAANSSQIQSSIAKLEELRFGPGYRTISSDAETSDYQLAPNPSGFLLEALFQSYLDYSSNSTPAVSHLLDGIWTAMVNQDEYYTGASWEYVKPNGSPGIGDLFTSLAHPWGAAPSYVLPEYLLGLRTTAPGYKSFILNPAIGFLGLNEARGRVPTPFGSINVSWTVNGTQGIIDVDAPEGTQGLLKVPSSWVVGGGNGSSGDISLSSGRRQVALTLV